MATTFGYSSKNSRSNGSGTSGLIALAGVRVTPGPQASICSIYLPSTAAAPGVTGRQRWGLENVWISGGQTRQVTLGDPRCTILASLLRVNRGLRICVGACIQ